MGKILVVGSLNMDMTVFTDRLPASGETLQGAGFLLSPGGKGANQSIAAAKLGAQVTLFGRVGDDVFGRTLVETQALNGVDTRLIRQTPGIPTGVASITVCEGNNSIIVVSGANAHVSVADVDALSGAIADSDALLLQMEVPMEAVRHAIGLAKAHGTTIFFNPAPAQRLDAALLQGVDFLLPNESETAILLGWPGFELARAEEALRAFARAGVKHPIITLGSAGVAYLWEGACVIEPPLPVDPIDTTAAGDTFAGALACAVVGGRPLCEAITFAQRAAALCVTRKGACNAIPTLDEVEQLTENTPR